ncbi:inositol monophosphatase family protein [Halovenus rubra]|uniref:Inositol monophosphatase family protein n=2 Tax=Halovenus rubra TaxID=869890 RepID=A0ACC7DYC1_9EURY|nr:inositol monophosphatase [Halovenus rubra]
MSDEIHRAAIAERAARAGGVVAQGAFREGIEAETKTDKNDLVSAADRDSQLQVIATIQQEFPGARLVCEEDVEPVDAGSGHELVETVPETGDAWVVDPIDGTGNYLRDIRFWATSVAAVTDGEPVAVATYMPSMEDIYTAGPESVTRNDTSMTVSNRTDPETFAVGMNGLWPVNGKQEWVTLFEAGIDQFGDLRRFGAMQGVLALVASGSLDAAFMPTRPHPWDSLAGVHLVRRAGGVATDIHGDRWAVDSDGLVVSNGEAHDAVLAVVQHGLDLET